MFISERDQTDWQLFFLLCFIFIAFPLLTVWLTPNWISVLHSAVLSRSVVSNSLWSHGLGPARLLCPWGFSRREYWSGLPCPPLGTFPTQGSNPGLPHCRQILYHLSQYYTVVFTFLKSSFIYHINSYISFPSHIFHISDTFLMTELFQLNTVTSLPTDFALSRKLSACQ